MRKALVLLLALVFVGGMAFADAAAPSIAINGFAETGVGFILPGASGATSYATQYNNDSGNTGRFRLGIAITSPDGNAGFISRLEGDTGVVGNAGNNSSAGNAFLGFNRLDGWGKLLGGALTIKGGVLDDTQFWTANRNWGGWIDGAAGLEVLVNAYPGLTVGYFLPLPGFLAPTTTPFNPVGFTGPFGGTFYSGDGRLIDVLSGSAIYANYVMANQVSIVAGFQGAHSTVSDMAQTGLFWAGVDVLAFPGITARVEFQAWNIGNTDKALGPSSDGVGGNAGQYNFFLEGAYAYPLSGGTLKADLGVWIDIYAASGSDLGYDFEPNISYNFGVATIGVVGDIGNTLTPYNPINNAAVYDVLLCAAAGVSGTKMSGDFGPYIGVPIGPGSSVNAGLLYTIGDFSNDTGTSNGTAIYVDVRYSF